MVCFMTSTQYLSSSTIRSTALMWPETERRRLTTSRRNSVRMTSSYPQGEGVDGRESAYAGRSAPRRSDATPRSGRVRRTGASRWGGPRATEGDGCGTASVDDPLGTAGYGEDHPRGDRREASELAVRHYLGGRIRCGRASEDHRRVAQASPIDGPADRAFHRRDPPLQQGAAGRRAPIVRGRRRDPARRDDREPIVRSDLGAALALAGLHAEAAHRGRGALDREAGADRRAWPQGCCGPREGR